jgi:hypothetical protein
MSQLSFPRYISLATFAAISSPADGDMVTIQIDASQGVNQTFRYVASSASIYKWEFIGGNPQFVRIGTGLTNSSQGVYQPLATPGPDILLNRGGDYVVEWGSLHQGASTNSQSNSRIYETGGSSVSNQETQAALTGSGSITSSMCDRLLNQPAGRTLRTYYKSSWSGTPTGWNNSWMKVTPLRIN